MRRRSPVTRPLSPAMSDGTTPRPTPSPDRAGAIGRAGTTPKPRRAAFCSALTLSNRDDVWGVIDATLTLREPVCPPTHGRG